MRPVVYFEGDTQSIFRLSADGYPEFPHGSSKAIDSAGDDYVKRATINLARNFLKTDLELEKAKDDIIGLKNRIRELEEAEHGRKAEQKTSSEGDKEAE